MTAIFSLCIAIPASDTMCPRNSTFRRNSEHFDGFNFKFAFRIPAKTSSRRSSCSAKVLPKTIISSR